MGVTKMHQRYSPNEHNHRRCAVLQLFQEQIHHSLDFNFDTRQRNCVMYFIITKVTFVYTILMVLFIDILLFWFIQKYDFNSRLHTNVLM